MASLFQKSFAVSVCIAIQSLLLLASTQVLASGIEFTNGRVESMSVLLFLSPEQQKEADVKHSVSLTMAQSVYLRVAARLERTEISLTLLSVEEAKKSRHEQVTKCRC